MTFTGKEWACLHMLPWITTLGDFGEDVYHLCQKRSVFSGERFQKRSSFPVYQFAMAMKTNTASTGFFTEIPLWNQQFDFRQIRNLKGSQPTFDFDAA